MNEQSTTSSARPADPTLLHSVPAVAEKLGVSTSTVFRLIALGELESFRFGGCRRITDTALAEFIAVRAAS
jgi:excisionase family DNA binding protein